MSSCSKTFSPCQRPSTDRATVPGVFGIGMPPCG